MAYIPGSVNTITIGGLTLSTTNLIILDSGSSGASNSLTSARKSSASAGYTPSSTNKFRIKAVEFINYAAGTGNWIGLGYSDNDVGWFTATAATNPVYVHGQINGYIKANGTNIDQVKVFYPDFLVPNGKYVLTSGQGGGDVFTVRIYGYEEA